MASLFLCFLCLSSQVILSSSSPTITLSLSPILRQDFSSNPWKIISQIAKSSIERAHYLKNPHKKVTSSWSSEDSVLHGTSKTPLYPRSYNEYAISLSFGTPPQKIPLVFDTGSSLLWVPCTLRYNCTNCTFIGVDPTKFTTFKPLLSSTPKLINCSDHKCGWLFGPDISENCVGSCPRYLQTYGTGNTTGSAISENLDLPGEVVPDFLLGCSLSLDGLPAGVAGFGKAPQSLPSQLTLKKFSYCLLSHKFDDKSKSSNLILVGARKSSGAGKYSGAGEVPGVKYTPFHKNPTGSPYNGYYYVNLRKITVGKNTVKLQHKLLEPDLDGNGGTIVDSGTTYTSMERAIYDPLMQEFRAQMVRYERAHDVEAQSHLGLCFNVSGEGNISLPELVFHFKGGAKMAQPVANYFTSINNALCLSFVTTMYPSGGPAIILGNYQQQNFYIEYDLENQRLGLKKQTCG